MPIVTLPGGEVRDEIRQPLYDTQDFITTAGGVSSPATLAGTYQFFTALSGIPASGVGQPVLKSLAKTNMTQQGQLPTATSFRVQGITLDAENALPANATILPVILERGSIYFFAGQKYYWQGPARFAAGRMLSSFATAVGGAALTYVEQQYGWPAIQPIVFRGSHVVDINPLQNFYVQLQLLAQDLTIAEQALLPAAGSDISVVCSLKGLLRRPVQ